MSWVDVRLIKALRSPRCTNGIRTPVVLRVPIVDSEWLPQELQARANEHVVISKPRGGGDAARRKNENTLGISRAGPGAGWARRGRFVPARPPLRELAPPAKALAFEIYLVGFSLISDVTKRENKVSAIFVRNEMS